MSRLTLTGTPRQYSGHYDIYQSLKAFVKRQLHRSLNGLAYNMQRRWLYIYVCVSLRLLSHLSLMFAQSREFLTSIIWRLSLFSDTPIGALSYPPFAALLPRFRRCYQCATRGGNFPRWELLVGIILFYFWLIATCGRRHYSRMNIQRRSRGRKSCVPRKLLSRFHDCQVSSFTSRVGSSHERHISPR